MKNLMEQNPKRIAIIELEKHPQFMEFLSFFFQEEEVHFYFSHSFFTKKIENQFTLKGKIFIQDPQEKLTDFMKRNLDNINNTDLVIISTLDRSKEVFLGLDLTQNLLINIHQLNEWFAKKISWPYLLQHTSGDIRYKGRRLRSNNILLRMAKAAAKLFIIYRAQKEIRKLLGKARYLNVFHPEMEKELQKMDRSTWENYVITTLPYRFPAAEGMETRSKDSLCIAIMGIIIPGARDYSGFLEALKGFRFPEGKQVRIMLLGTFKNKKYQGELEKLMEEISNKQVLFQTFPGHSWLSQREMDRHLEEVDVIISLIRMDGVGWKTKEIYGRTKASAIDFDAFYYGKPLFVPDRYAPIHYLRPIYEFYSDYNHLNALLNKYMDPQVLAAKTNGIRKMQDGFLLEELRKDFYDKVFQGKQGRCL